MCAQVFEFDADGLGNIKTTKNGIGKYPMPFAFQLNPFGNFSFGIVLFFQNDKAFCRNS